MTSLNYSIIVPHYNIPDLLIRCIKSIPDREDLEIIVVDDCSPRQKETFDKLELLHKKNLEWYTTSKGGSAGHARNVGIEHARGKWIIFADADDFFNYCFNDILESHKNNDASVIFFNANSVDVETYQICSRNAHLSAYIDLRLKNKSLAEDMLRYIYGEPWCRIVKRDLINQNNILFEETSIHNDALYSYTVGLKAKKIEIDERCGYCVTDRQGSVSKQISEDRLITRVEVFTKKYRTLLENKLEYYDPVIPDTMKQLLREKNIIVYNKCLDVLKKYGFGEEIINKKPFENRELNILILKNKYHIPYDVAKEMYPYEPLQSIRNNHPKLFDIISFFPKIYYKLIITLNKLRQQRF